VNDPQLKKDWRLHEDAFRRLLAWLDEGADSRGARYLEIRRRLVAYFLRKGSTAADDLADETLTRVARRLADEQVAPEISSARYCYAVARLVHLEHRRTGPAREVNIETVPCEVATPAWPDDVSAGQTRRLDCLDRCLSRLGAEYRRLIVEYYCGERREKIERRRQMALRLGLSLNAMAIRACRIRGQLEVCVKGCAGE